MLHVPGVRVPYIAPPGSHVSATLRAFQSMHLFCFHSSKLSEVPMYNTSRPRHFSFHQWVTPALRSSGRIASENLRDCIKRLEFGWICRYPAGVQSLTIL